MIDIQDQVPVRLVDVADEDGLVVLRKPKMGRFGTGLLRLFRIDPLLTLRLDDLGSDVWRLLDGRTAGAVLAALQEQHPDEDDLPERLGRHLGTLVGHGLVRLDQPSQG